MQLTIIRDEINCLGNGLLRLGGFFPLPLVKQLLQFAGRLRENVESGADC